MHDDLDLSAFARRVRLVAAWRGFAVGLAGGSILACVLVAVERLRGHVAPWPHALAAVAAACIAGAALGAFRRVTTTAVADSVDRRAGLKNRLGTALSEAGDQPGNDVAAALHSDAVRQLQQLRPARVYPVRFGTIHGMALALALVAGVVAVLGNRPIILSEAERAKAADSADAAAAIQRVLDRYREPKAQSELGKLGRSEVAEMERLQRDLENGNADREAALQRANKALDDAKKLEAQTAQQAKANLAQAQTAIGAMTSANGDRNSFDASAQVASELRNEASDLQRQIDDLQRQLKGASKSQAEALKNQLAQLKRQRDALNQAANEAAQATAALQAAEQRSDTRSVEDALRMESAPGSGGNNPLAEFMALKAKLMATIQAEIANIKERLKTATGAEAERLRTKLAELQGELEAARKQVEAYNKALRAALKAMKARKQQPTPQLPLLHTKFNKPMRSAMSKLMQALNKVESGDDLSKEEAKDLQRIANQMQVQAATAASRGDKEQAMTATVLADAAQGLADGNSAIAIAMACRNSMAIGGPSDASLHEGSGGIDMVSTKDEHNVHKVHHLKNPTPGRGTTTPTVVDPLRGEGPESYIEIRGPATLGGRSGIPYRTVLPSYQRKEEAALSEGQIPKKDQKRVRAYFDALNGR